MMQPKTIGDTLSRLQREVETLKELLTEARDATGGACASACGHANCVLRRRIDAVLTETP